MKPVVVIIGAGPAGLTAALELAKDGRFRPLVLEASDCVGGISRTVVYKGNRMDIGGHRFFSKSDWVMDWWRAILPLQTGARSAQITYHGQRRIVQADAEGAERWSEGRVLLLRQRLSRIYFLRRYFDYPIKLNAATVANLGLVRIVRIGWHYLWAMAFPRRPERSLEDFLVNRFGAELYRTFFKDYTEKVWGVPCHRISAEWGAQRIKGLSILEALRHAMRAAFGKKATATKTSLIEQFLYPRLGPGQLWEEVARRVEEAGGEIHFGRSVVALRHESDRITSVSARKSNGELEEFCGAYFISTMAVKDLIAGMNPTPPEEVRRIACDLPYRDFLTVGLLLRRMRANPQARSESETNAPADNWIYIQEPDVRIGRLQVFNNWSPDLVADPATVWLGLEYFCQEGDDLWSKSDEEMRALAVSELAQIGMIDATDVLDGTVVRVPKTYPAYFGAYAEFGRVRDWVDRLENLFLVGRNGMHRYNNQDHSMLTAKLAVESILAGTTDKARIWAVNIDDEYHEQKG